MDLKRRTLLAAGAAAAASTAVPRVFAQQPASRGTGKFYEKGSVRIYYEQAGSGFPLMLLPGGGLNSTIAFFTGNAPFNAIAEFKSEYRCITADLRNAPTGQSTGPIEVGRPWESYADDQLGLMDHLGIDKFMVMGFCIGGPFIWNLLKRAPNRIAGAVVAQPVGWRPEMRDPKYPGVFWRNWPAQIAAKRPEVTLQAAEQFVTRKFETDPDFVFTVPRAFVRPCPNPAPVPPGRVPAHPLAVAMKCSILAPKAEVTVFPWKEPKERIPLAVRQIHSFLRAHLPAYFGSVARFHIPRCWRQERRADDPARYAPAASRIARALSPRSTVARFAESSAHRRGLQSRRNCLGKPRAATRRVPSECGSSANRFDSCAAHHLTASSHSPFRCGIRRQPNHAVFGRRTEMHVAKSRREIAMAGELLNRLRRGLPHRQMRAERVPKDMRPGAAQVPAASGRGIVSSDAGLRVSRRARRNSIGARRIGIARSRPLKHHHRRFDPVNEKIQRGRSFVQSRTSVIGAVVPAGTARRNRCPFLVTTY